MEINIEALIYIILISIFAIAIVLTFIISRGEGGIDAKFLVINARINALAEKVQMLSAEVFRANDLEETIRHLNILVSSLYARDAGRSHSQKSILKFDIIEKTFRVLMGDGEEPRMSLEEIKNAAFALKVSGIEGRTLDNAIRHLLSTVNRTRKLDDFIKYLEEKRPDIYKDIISD